MSGKPNGIGITMGSDGIPHYYVSPVDRVADRIWDSVRDAICVNMTPEQFKQQAAEAWEYHLKQDSNSAIEILTGRKPRGW